MPIHLRNVLHAAMWIKAIELLNRNFNANVVTPNFMLM